MEKKCCAAAASTCSIILVLHAASYRPEKQMQIIWTFIFVIVSVFYMRLQHCEVYWTNLSTFGELIKTLLSNCLIVIVSRFEIEVLFD